MSIDLARPRLKDLRDRLAKLVPCIPNTESIRAEFDIRPLPEVLIHYVNWADRFVPPRPRSVEYARNFWTDAAASHMERIFEIEKEIRDGCDLSGRLSKKTRTAGYAPNARNRWIDKDFCLNAYDVHHLHIGHSRGGGVCDRTKELLFVSFSRYQAFILLLGDHRSFHDGTLEEAIGIARSGGSLVLKGMSTQSQHSPQELNQLAKAGFSTTMSVNGTVVMMAGINASGHRTRSLFLADKIMMILEGHDPTIDEAGFVERVFGAAASRLADPPKFQWQMHYCDLALTETQSNIAGIFVQADR